MSMRETLLSIIEQSFEELNDTREPGNLLSFHPEVALYGANSSLDSVDLVNLLLAIEERIEDELDISFTIANEKALSQKNSPFKTVKSLCDYLQIELAK
ncbi:hypothetical protein DRW07_16785 [Alteromonas sediminis]|uniref:Carrier domain-containing protein n=1 Tax=Alteromonas sediminis TaxID=2259342 RepID=A0A3N5Y8Z8_9ALTE|nr:hypothetical protein [Alteromonas sediminis]RPJ64975.1 hypothetical protein DRW07_16785 [Alteromonas sediminis]